MRAGLLFCCPQLIAFAALESRFGFVAHPRDVAAIASHEIALCCAKMTGSGVAAFTFDGATTAFVAAVFTCVKQIHGTRSRSAEGLTAALSG